MVGWGGVAGGITAGEQRIYLRVCVFTEFKDGKTVDLFVTQKDLLQIL